MQNFTFEAPQTIIFGMGEKKSLPHIAARFGKKVLIITGTRSAKDSGLQEKIGHILSDSTVLFTACPEGEPSCESIDAIEATARDFSPDVLVALGGGSVIDTVKAVSCTRDEHESIEEYLEGSTNQKQIEKPGIPWIAIPTTAGTGSEATKNSVIRSLRQKAKRSLRSPFLLASAAIIDPEVTLSLPTYISGITGIDALTQLIESFVSIKSNIVTQSLVRGAFPMMMGALKRIASNPYDREARCTASYGSLISGIALTNSGLGAVHGFASGIGGIYDIPHGAICACFLLHVLKENTEEIRDKISFLTSDFPIGKKTDPVVWLIDQIAEIYGLFGIPKDLKTYRIDKVNAKTIIEKSKGSSMTGNPKKLTDEDLERILLEVI